MRDDDRRRFEEERLYKTGADATKHFDELLGLDVTAVIDLNREVASDLDRLRFGVGWWAPHPDDKRRILISDHLLQSIVAIDINQIEAALHRLEYLDALEREERHTAYAVGRNGLLSYPQPRKAADLLPMHLMTMHLSGFFRALGSTLDCLAAVVVGVLAVPMTIVTADFSKLRSWFQGVRQKSTQRHPLQTRFGIELDEIISRAGPQGWIDWLEDYRNMLVHRARRLQLTVFGVEKYIVDPSGRPVPRVIPVPVLPNDPSRSDVQAMLEDPVSVLKEDARKTMCSIFGSVRFLIRESCSLLRQIWEERRRQPSLLLQPREQWPKLEPPRSNVFSGYESVKLPIQVDVLMSDPSLPRRLDAAALTKEKRPLWDSGLSG